jgi:hypothetical protein
MWKIFGAFCYILPAFRHISGHTGCEVKKSELNKNEGWNEKITNEVAGAILHTNKKKGEEERNRD